MVKFTNTGTGDIYANIGIAASKVAPGATYVAFWPSAHGDLYPSFDWHANELPDPAGAIGEEFATGEVHLVKACSKFFANGVKMFCAGGGDGPHVTMTNTGSGTLVAYGPTIGQRAELDDGEHVDFRWPLAPNGTLWDPFVWEFYYLSGNLTETLASTGEFTVAKLNEQCAAVKVPSAPRSLAAKPGNRAVTLRWTAPSANGGAAITDYLVQRSPNGRSGWVTLKDGVRTRTSYTVTGLVNGRRYHFRVLAKNSAGVGAASNVVKQIPRTVPAAPRLRAQPGSGRAKLSWTAPSTTGGAAITRYVIQRSTSTTRGWTTLRTRTPSTARSFTISGLRNGVRYYFRIAAVNAAGTGAWSQTVSVTPSARRRVAG